MADLRPDGVEQPFPLTYAMVALMSILAAWLASLIAGILVSNWRAGAYLAGAALLIGGGVLLREAIAREQPSASTLAALRMRELLLVLGGSAVGSLILPYLPWHPLGLIDMLLNIWFDPQQYVDGRNILTALLLIGAWAFAIRPLDALDRLVVKRRDLPRPRSNQVYDDLTAVRLGLPDLTLVHRKLAGWTLSTLIVLAVVLALFWRNLGGATHIAVGGAILAYAVLGFTLLALASFELRRSRWLIEGVTPEGETADRWAAAGGGLAAGLAVLALIVPAILLLALTRAVIAGVLVAFFHLMRLAGVVTPSGAGGFRQPVLPLMPFPQAAPSTPAMHSGTMPGWLLPVIFSFATLVVGLGVILVASRLRQGGRSPRLRWLQSLAGLLAFLARLDLALRRWLSSLRSAAAALTERLKGAPRTLAARVHRRHGPADTSGGGLVRYWYGQMVRQGARTGFPRRSGQTAREYQVAIQDQLGRAREDLEELTAAYVHARYSGREVSATRGTAAQHQFQRIRQAMAGWLRRRGRGQAPPGPKPTTP